MIKTRQNKLAVDKFQDETIIVDFETGIYYSLRGSACFIWDVAENGLDPKGAKELFKEISAEQGNRIDAFIHDLRAANLVQEMDAPTPDVTDPQDYSEILFEQYKDMEDLIMLDPIHEVDERGWPHKKA